MNRTNDFIVGLTVLVAAIIIVLASIWATGLRPGAEQRALLVRVREAGNTRVGNAVVIRGVQAGRVQAIELAPGGWVHLRLDMDRNVELPPDPAVILSQTSLFGEWQATVTSRAGVLEDPDVRRQLEEASGEPGMIPGATLPDIGQLTAVAGRLAGDVASVAGRVEVAFDDSAARELRLAIRNVARLSSDLADAVSEQTGNLDTLARDARRVVRSLHGTAEALRRTAARVDSGTAEGQVEQIVADLSAASTRLRETSEELHALSRSLGPAGNSLAAVLARADTLTARLAAGEGTMGLMLRDSSLYHHGDSLLVDLRALVRDIRQNPRRYVNVRVF